MHKGGIVTDHVVGGHLVGFRLVRDPIVKGQAKGLPGPERPLGQVIAQEP